MSHDAITLIASLSVIASLHLSFALRAHIKRTPVLAAINRTEGGIPSVHIQQCIQMIKHHTVITPWAQYEYISNNDEVQITYWPKPGLSEDYSVGIFIGRRLIVPEKAYPACTSTSLANGREHYAMIKSHAV